MNSKKVAMLVGRGIEGCGVTQFVIQMKNWMSKNGIDTTVYAWSDKKWGRAKSMPLEYKEINKLHEGDKLKNLISELNEYDYVFINSVPSINHPEDCINSFLELIKNITATKCIFQNDHKIQSIRRNANFMEITHLCDKIVTFSKNSAFAVAFAKDYSKEEFESKYIQIFNPCDMSRYAKWRKDKHLNRITYLGRFATFKDPGRLYSMKDELSKMNVQTEFIGIERSLGALPLLRKQDENGVWHDKEDLVFKASLKEDTPYDQRDINKVYMFGPYNQEEAFEHISNSLFGCEFFNLKSGTYGNCLEYAMAEIVGLGCIPLFDYNWGEEVYCYENGEPTNKRFIDVKYSGIYLKKDLSNLNEVLDEMKKIMNDPELQETYRKVSYETIQKHLDPDKCLSKMFADIGLK